MPVRRSAYKPYSKILMLTICSLNKKAGGMPLYDETASLACRLKIRGADLLKVRREALDLLYSGEIKWQGIPLVKLDYNKELTAGKDFGENVQIAKYLPAIDRYNGRFYQTLGRYGKDKLLGSSHHVLFQSGLYGLVMPTEDIQLYSFPIEGGSKAQEIWTKDRILTKILVEYVTSSGIERIFDLTSRDDYRELIDWDYVARNTKALALHCFSIMCAGDYALIPFAEFMKDYMLEASENELLAIKPGKKNGIFFLDDLGKFHNLRDNYPSEDSLFENWKKIQRANSKIENDKATVQGKDWRIQFTSEFHRSFRLVGDKKLEGRILELIVELSENPAEERGNNTVILLKRTDENQSSWRYKFGKYRLFYDTNSQDHIMSLGLVDSRGDLERRYRQLGS